MSPFVQNHQKWNVGPLKFFQNPMFVPQATTRQTSVQRHLRIGLNERYELFLLILAGQKNLETENSVLSTHRICTAYVLTPQDFEIFQVSQPSVKIMMVLEMLFLSQKVEFSSIAFHLSHSVSPLACRKLHLCCCWKTRLMKWVQASPGVR